MEASLWSGPVILTLCLSVLALIVSVTALIWQVVSWRRSGPQVRVSSRVGVADTVPFVSIEITNAGRMATEVNQLGFQLSALDDRQHIVMFRDALGMLVALPLGAFLLILLRQLHATYLASIQSTHGAQAHTDSTHSQ